MSWVSLPAGNSSEAACLQACEAERTNGCCRFGDKHVDSKVPSGCAMGNGRTLYDPRVKAARVSKCAGQAFIFFCKPDSSWNLAPPSAWDVIDSEACYNAATKSYYHSLAVGDRGANITAGFSMEWGVKKWPARYVQVDADITLRCPSVAIDRQSPNPASSPASSNDDESPPVLLFVLVAAGAVILIMISIIAYLACRRTPTSAGNTTFSGAVLSPEQEANPGTIVVGKPVGGSAATGCNTSVDLEKANGA